MGIILRPAELPDISQMAAIRAVQWETDAFWTHRIAAYLTGEHSPQHALAARAVFVAVDGDRLVGFVAGHRTRRLGCDGELQWIDVVEDRRGAGIAEKLIGKIGTWFVEIGAGRICVNVAPENIAARKVYARCGAQPLNDYWMLWKDSCAMCTAVDV